MIPVYSLRTARRLALALAISSLLAGCAGLDAGRELISGLTESIFGDDDSADPPAELTDYTAELQVEIEWKTSIGSGSDKQHLKLVPAVRDGRVYAADHGGDVQARDAKDGDTIWDVSTDFVFAAGPALGLQSVIVGTTQGEIVCFDLGTGEQKWVSTLPSEVQAIPVVTRNIVIVRTTDGKIIGLRESDGGKLWTAEQSVPALSVRGAGTPLVIDNTVIVGSAGGKLQALQVADGKSLWEATIAMPSGRSEIERLVDLDVDPIDSRGAIYVASFQGGTASVSSVDGDIIWRNQDISTYTGISADWRYLYVSDNQSTLWQLDQRNGASLWSQKELHNRQLTAPAVYDNYVVAGDFEGYVHWFSVSDGRPLGRVQVTSAPIEAKPVVVDGTVFIYAKDGTLAALKAK